MVPRTPDCSSAVTRLCPSGSACSGARSVLDFSRTAAVRLKSKTDLAPLHAEPDGQSRVTAELQSGVLGTIKRCTGTWCRLAGEDFDGWIEQGKLWGVY